MRRSSNPERSLFPLAALLAGLLLWGCGGNEPLNLVVITMDTTRADHLGIYGYEGARTPNIDALAREGFLFRSHLTPVPITLPSHTSLFTGHYPPTHTVRDNGTFTVPEGETTLAEVLQARGYRTSAFVASFPLAGRFNLDQGFENYDEEFDSRYRDIDGFRIQAQSGLFFDERPASDVVDAALEHLKSRPSGPFFTFLHFFDPHQPMTPPSPYDLVFREQPYDGEIAFVDEQLGRLFDFLKQEGLWNNTLIVLTADHGEGLGEHGELTHSILLHQATLHIPLIVRDPRQAPGETAEWTDSTQVMATVLDLLDVPYPDVDIPISKTLAPVVRGGAFEREGPFVAYFETLSPRASQGWSQLVAYMQDDVRYVHGPEPEMYDLAEDPKELNNLYGQRPEEARHALTMARTFLDDFETVPVGEAFSEIDEETMARLEALGYVGEGIHQMGDMRDMLDVAGLKNPRDLVADIGLYSEAKAAYTAGNLSLSLALFQELLSHNERNATAHRFLALINGGLGEWEACYRHLERVAEITPDDEQLGLLTGMLYIQSGRTAEGMAILENQAGIRQSLEGCLWLGRAYQDSGRDKEAERWFRQVLDIDPGHRWGRMHLANQLAREERFAEAEPIYHSLIEEFPYFQLAYYNFGRMYLEQGQSEVALPLLKRSAKLDPGHELTRHALNQASAGSP